MSLLRVGGRFGLAGATFPGRPAQWPAEQVVRRRFQIVGVYNYSSEVLENALHFLALNPDRFPFAELAPRSFPLGEVNAVFECAES